MEMLEALKAHLRIEQPEEDAYLQSLLTMEKCSFFNSINGDRRYKAEEWADYFSSFIGNGVFGYASDNLLVSAMSGMTIAIGAGKAWINGYFYHNTEALTTTLATADGVLNRIDRVVLRWSLAARSIAVAVKQGVAASIPVAPTLQRDADVYELALADVLVGKGVLLILQSNITDQRLNSAVCGLVTQTIIAFDTSHYADQLSSLLVETQQRVNADILALSEQLNTQLDENQAAFDAWFARLQTTLDGNVAGNLFDKIDAHVNLPILFIWLAISILATLRYKPEVFHNYICPFGVLQRVFGRAMIFSKKVDAELCIGCKKCEKVCPSMAIAVNGEDRKAEISKSLCHQCNNCSAACPVSAIRYQRSARNTEK